MFDENECEIASSIGYQCLNCRPTNEPPPHIQGMSIIESKFYLNPVFLARKNGTLRSIFNKKRAEERNDLELMKKSEQQQQQKTRR